MSKYYLTKKAVEDLSDIWLYTYENWSEKQADIYYYLLVESFEEISIKPNIGKNYLRPLHGKKIKKDKKRYINICNTDI